MKLIAIWLGKAVLFLTKLSRMGGGTTLPGLIAESIDKNIIKKLSKKITYGTIIVTGTNGKTTTSKIIADILKEEGFEVVRNYTGSNLTRGIASSLVDASNIFGTRLRADVAVFEVDEATMPEATTKLRPKLVVVTNLFRDQLDRYGELDKTAEIIGSSLKGLTETTVLLNADDPLVANISDYADGSVKYFGIEDKGISTSSKAAIDSKDCVYCGQELDYQNRYMSHLGVWSCPRCKKSRPKPQFFISGLKLDPQKSRFSVHFPSEKFDTEIKISGLYNAYNALIAAAAAHIFGIGIPAISHTIRNLNAVFGRMEAVCIDDKKVIITLVKNPTGANQVLSAIYSSKKPQKIAIFLNDNYADGTDISWIWDIDFEHYIVSKSQFLASGIRAEEIALRLKYAGVPEKDIILEKDSKKAVEKFLKKMNKGETAYILPTYTAMIELRDMLVSDKDEVCNLGKVTKYGI